jgi:hypothetical protein
MIDGLGWIATAVFSASYFFRKPRAMLAVQVCAAILWIGYGLLSAAAPVVVANGIVAAAALWRWTRGDRPPEGTIGA